MLCNLNTHFLKYNYLIFSNSKFIFYHVFSFFLNFIHDENLNFYRENIYTDMEYQSCVMVLLIQNNSTE